MGKKKAGSIPTISGDGFKGKGDLTRDDIKKLVVEGYGKDSMKSLTTDWSGEVAGVVTVSLSNDNKRIIEGRFCLIGSLFTNKKVTAGKFWSVLDLAAGQPQPAGTVQPDQATAVTGSSVSMPEPVPPPPQPWHLMYSIPDCEVFRFPDGGLVSEIVDGDRFPHSFYRGETLVPEDELPEGYLGFSLRAYVAPTRETYAKITILMYPLAKELLVSAHPLSRNSMFPGITLFSGEFPLIPKSSAQPRQKGWGCPLVPAVIPGMDLEDSTHFPRSPLLRAAIAQVLRKAVKHEAKSNHPNLIQRWSEINEYGISRLKDLQLDHIWPLPTVMSEEFTEGRVVVLMILLCNLTPLQY